MIWLSVDMRPRNYTGRVPGGCPVGSVPQVPLLGLNGRKTWFFERL
jgi:hypothetical protein